MIALKKKLQAVRHEHFMAKTVYQKTKLRNRDKELRDELAQMLTDDNVIASADAKQLVAWNPYDQNGKASFFDPEWMFGIKDGFDVVIGNPPYIPLQDNNGKLAELYKNANYTTYTRTGDIYCLFYERGYKLLNRNGNVCYITSNKWMRTEYGEKTRKFLYGNTNPLIIIDFNGIQVFKSATVDTNILIFKRGEYIGLTKSVIVTKENKNKLYELKQFVDNNHIVCSFKGNSKWIIMSDMERKLHQKIINSGDALSTWNLKINFGIKTGYNPAFVISTETRNKIISSCHNSQERNATDAIIRPLLRGRDIDRYKYNWSGKWLINVHNGLKGKFNRIHVEDYPVIKEHLDCYYSQIVSRSDKGDTSYNLRNCAYIELFAKPKIIWKRIGSILRFSFDNTGAYGLDSTCFATGEHLEYLCCLLNSKMGHYLLKDSPKTGTGDLLISVQAVEPIHVPYPSKEVEKKLIELLKLQIDSYSEKRDTEIDKIIYDIYDLNDEERTYVNSYEF